MGCVYLIAAVRPFRAFVPSAMTAGNAPVSSGFISQIAERRWQEQTFHITHDGHVE